MPTDSRLRAIEARCKALRWPWNYFKITVAHLVLCVTGRALDEKSMEWLQAAERLLALHEPGPDVEVTINGIKYKLVRWDDDSDTTK